MRRQHRQGAPEHRAPPARPARPARAPAGTSCRQSPACPFATSAGGLRASRAAGGVGGGGGGKSAGKPTSHWRGVPRAATGAAQPAAPGPLARLTRAPAPVLSVAKGPGTPPGMRLPRGSEALVHTRIELYECSWCRYCAGQVAGSLERGSARAGVAGAVAVAGGGAAEARIRRPHLPHHAHPPPRSNAGGQPPAPRLRPLAAKADDPGAPAVAQDIVELCRREGKRELWEGRSDGMMRQLRGRGARR